MLQHRNSISWGTYLLRGEIKWLVVEWTCRLVEFHHNYNDFDCFISYGSRLELWLSLGWAVQTRHISQTIQATRINGQYIWVSEPSTWWFDHILWLLKPSFVPFFLFLRNITLKVTEKQPLWRNNKSIIGRLWGRSLNIFFVLWMCFSTIEMSWFVRMVWCSNVIPWSVHGGLTTSNTLTCTQSSNPIARCAKHQNTRFDKGIYPPGDP